MNYIMTVRTVKADFRDEGVHTLQLNKDILEVYRSRFTIEIEVNTDKLKCDRIFDMVDHNMQSAQNVVVNREVTEIASVTSALANLIKQLAERGLDHFGDGG